MVKNVNQIQLTDITVYYGKTLLKDFLNYGYTIEEERMYFHEESSTVMCGFLKDMKYLGELIFFDIEKSPTIEQLKSIPINLILLDDESLEINNENLINKKIKKPFMDNKLYKKNKLFKEEKNSKKLETFSEFLEFKGIKGKKDIKFLISGYIFCWFIVALGYNNIPRELIYVTVFLPVAFFSVAFIFWLIKRIFSYLYNRIPKSLFIVVCTIICVGWNYLISLGITTQKYKVINTKEMIVKLISFGFFILISGFITYQIIRFWVFNDNNKGKKYIIKKYLPIHIVLYVILILIRIFVKGIDNNFLILLYIQFGIYGIISAIAWFRILLSPNFE